MERIRAVEAGLVTLLRDAERARRQRAETMTGKRTGAICAWNHFENIPTFYNWNNRPR
ncbi:MAG TPA: multiple cyclophane-containing RiPP AmcA [Micromonosporaceae bacterium]